MNTKQLIILTTSILLGLVLIPLGLHMLVEMPTVSEFGAQNARAASHTVCPAGPPTCDYDDIQAAVDAAGDGDTIKVAAGTYSDMHVRPRDDITTTGVVTQVVYINKTITVRGGYTTNFVEPPDAEINHTVLDANGKGRVIYITGRISPTIEGLRITGGDTTGFGDAIAASEGGSGMYVITATTTISNCWIYSNTSVAGGVYLLESDSILGNNTIQYNDGGGVNLDSSNALISGNLITSNASYIGGGLFLFHSDATLVGNTIQDHSVSGEGGGLYIWRSNATLIDNIINENSAHYDGGGLYVQGGEVTLIKNKILSNNALGYGGGLYFRVGEITLNENTISANTADEGGGVYIDGSAILNENIISENIAYEGGGGYLYGDDIILTRNSIISNTAQLRGGGVSLAFGEANLNGNIISYNKQTLESTSYDSGGGGLFLLGYIADGNWALIGNTISNNSAYSKGGGLYSGAGSNSTLINNIIADNQVERYGSGIFVHGSSSQLLHNTITRNQGGDGSGLHVAGGGWGWVFPYSDSHVFMTNTVLVSQTVGITVTKGSTATLDATLWGDESWANGADWGGDGTVNTGTINIWDTPDFVYPNAGNYHIGSDSAARDAGVNAGVSEDIDGEPRPIGIGYDIGADEFTVSLSVTKQATPDPVKAGDNLTYTIYITNTSQVNLHATITDTLPAQVAPSGELNWTPIITAPGGIWKQPIVVTVNPGYSGVLTNEVQVSTIEGATGIYTLPVTVISAYSNIFMPLVMNGFQ